MEIWIKKWRIIVILLIENYILSVFDFKLNKELLEINGMQFQNEKEIEIIKNQIINDLENGKSIIDLRKNEIPDFIKFINSREAKFL